MRLRASSSCLVALLALVTWRGSVDRGAEAKQATASRMPNILFFFGDDWGRCAGAYRDPGRPSISDAVRTPTFDRLAREGVVFDNAFMPVPQCAPTRGSIATGSYFWRCGRASILAGGQWDEYPDPGRKLPGFGNLLAERGYYVAKSWKALQRFWMGSNNIGAGSSLKRYSQHVSAGNDAAEQRKRHQEVVGQTRDCIRILLRACPPDRPFFYCYGPINTHRPWVRGSGKALWGIDPQSLKGILPAWLPDVAEIREDVADYLGEIQALDLMAGVLVEELEKAGRLDNTLGVLV